MATKFVKTIVLLIFILGCAIGLKDLTSYEKKELTCQSHFEDYGDSVSQRFTNISSMNSFSIIVNAMEKPRLITELNDLETGKNLYKNSRLIFPGNNRRITYSFSKLSLHKEKSYEIKFTCSNCKLVAGIGPFPDYPTLCISETEKGSVFLSEKNVNFSQTKRIETKKKLAISIKGIE